MLAGWLVDKLCLTVFEIVRVAGVSGIVEMG